MVKEAEEHAEEDRKRREEVDARNEVDALAHRAEQLLNELGDQVPVNQKAQAEQLVSDARQAIAEEAGTDRVRPLISDLQQIIQALPSGAAAAGQGGGNGTTTEEEAATEDEEDVVDAEFTRE
jgi:molecular chaperone DnaK